MERLTERDSNGMTFLVCREGCNGGPACIECEQKAIDRLAAYEDTGLEPEEIMKLKARSLTGVLESPEMEEYHGSALERADNPIEQYESLGPLEHIKELIQAEKEGRLAALPPNAPLTLEELREMDGEPVWAESLYDESESMWTLVDSGGDASTNQYLFDSDDYGESWVAYRRRPEEGTT